MKQGLWLLLLFVFVFSQTGVAQQMDEAEKYARMEKIIEHQQQQIQALQERLQALEEPASEESTSQTSADYRDEVVQEYLLSPDTAEEGAEFGYETGRGFFLRVPNFEMYLSGAILMGLAIFENDTPDDNTFYPHGVILANDVYFYKEWHGRIELNFHIWANNLFQGPIFADGVQLWDAYIEYLGMRDEHDQPMVALRVGQTHVPFTIEGQYNPNQGPSIWPAPFIANWSHGRDPGLVLWGVVSNMLEYKFGVYNGEGRTTTNATDDFLFAGSFRFYLMGRHEEPGLFVHVGAIRSRDNNVHGSGNVAAATLTTPWTRVVFDGVWGSDWTQGWRTGVDAGVCARMALGDDKVNSIGVEGEFMYITWERNFATGRLPFLEGYGAAISLKFKHNLTPETPGAGIYPLFRFSYSDVDNKESDSTRAGANILGQRVWTYTAGIGYSFSEHIGVELDWVMVDLDEMDIYNTAANSAKDDRPDGSDDIEHAWFLQFVAQW